MFRKEIKYDGYRYRFSDEEKARILRRKRESTIIRDSIERWYWTITLFKPNIHRSMRKDIDRNTGYCKNKDITIIKYNLLSQNHGMIMDLARSDRSYQEKILGLLDSRLELNKVGPFRIKFTISHAQFSDEIEGANLQVIFVEEKDRIVEPQGDHITILNVKNDIELLP